MKHLNIHAGKFGRTLLNSALVLSILISGSLDAQPGKNNNNGNKNSAANNGNNGNGNGNGNNGNNGNGNNGSNNGGGSNCMPQVSAIFAGDNKTVTAISSKDLSNVVLFYCDGTHQKFDNLSGYSKDFKGTGANADKKIQGVWIKSGCNQSGDGPGYGEYVANSAEYVCTTPPPPVPASCYAHEVVSYTPGKTYNGTAIPSTRTNPEKALGEPERSDATTPENANNFVSLGFGGELVIRFEYPIANGPGADVKVWETTNPGWTGNCVTYPETVQAYASQDGCSWYYMGSGCQDAEFDLGELAWAQYIKLVDVSPKSAFASVGHNVDGYDVDGIECLNGSVIDPIYTETVCVAATEIIEFNQALRKDGQAVLAVRSDATKALGTPERIDSPNYVSLGFGGSIVLGFNCVIFDKPGYDIEIVETSYDSPACSSYPERARIEGSLDLLSWEYLGEICQDGMIDLAGKSPVKYLRITDLSDASKFSNSVETDGFDVDGVVVLQPGCTVGAPRLSETSLNLSASETSIYPNPFADQFTVNFTTGVAENISIRVYNALGQEILSETFASEGNTEVRKSISLNSSDSGIYFLSIERNGERNSFRLVKH